MTKLISVTKAITEARTTVTPIQPLIRGEYRYSYYDAGYEAWVETRPTWYENAVAGRRVHIAEEAVRIMISSAKAIDPGHDDYYNCRGNELQYNASEEIMNGASLKDTVKKYRALVAHEVEQ